MALRARLALPSSFYVFSYPEEAKPDSSARFRFRVLSLKERLELADAGVSENGRARRLMDAFDLLRKSLIGWEGLEDETMGPVRFEDGGADLLPMDIANWALQKAAEVNYGAAAAVKQAEPPPSTPAPQVPPEVQGNP